MLKLYKFRNILVWEITEDDNFTIKKKILAH